MSVKPRQSVPDLDLPLAGGGRYRLGENPPESFTVLVVYRGLHCPICKKYLSAFHDRLSDFGDAGAEVVAVSTDSAERAEKAKEEWGIGQLTVAHSLPVADAREWGLYISNAIKDGEPDAFTEPGLFLITPNGKLQMAVINSMPHLRPAPEDVLKTIAFIKERDYPARGEA